MQQQRGFTLIELIIVIVILGILAVTAAPKFIDIRSDAQSATLKGVKAALQGGAQLVYAKSAIAGNQKNASDSTSKSQVKIANKDVDTNFGYPNAASNTSTSDLAKWVDISDGEFTVVVGATSASTAATSTTPGSGTFAIISATGSPTVDYTETGLAGDSCHVLYKGAVVEGDSPEITVVAGKC